MNSKEAFQLVSNKVRYTSRLYEDELKLIQQDLDRLEKIIKILKGRVGVYNGYLCYDILLEDYEIELLKEVLGNER